MWYVLLHDYFAAQKEVGWCVVEQDLPGLNAEVGMLVRRLTKG